MDLFTYLLAKNDKFSLVHKSDLFAYLLGKNNSIPLKTAEGVHITIEALKTKINELKTTKESSQVTTTGKNMCSTKSFTSTSSERIIGESSTVYGIPVENGKNYNVSFDVTTLPSSDYRVVITISSDSTVAQGSSNIPNKIGTGTVINATNLQRYSGNITPIDDGYLYIRCIPSGFVLDNIQVEQGSATDYEPYTGGEASPSPDYPQEVEVVEGYIKDGNNYVDVTVEDNNGNSNVVSIPLNGNFIAGIGDYKDTLIVDKFGKCYLNKKIAKVVFVGTEDGWSVNSPETGVYCFIRTLNGSHNVGNARNKDYIMSNYFRGVIDNSIGGMYQYQTQIYFNMDSSICSSVDEFKTWLSTHNTDVYYVLEQENLIDLNCTIDLKLFKGENNISNSEDMMMTLKYY